MNKNILFKQNGDTYDMWYIDKEGEHDMGVNFAIPEGTRIEDYPIKIEEFDSSGKRKLRPCQNLKVILANPPKETEVVIFSIDAGVISNTNTALKIEKELVVRNNKNMELTLPEVKGAKPYLTFYKLNIESNKDSSLSFARLSSKNGESILSKENFISLRTQTSTYGNDEVHSLVTNSPRLHFNPNSSTSILYENKIVSEGDVAFSSKKSNALASISLDFEGKGAELGSNEIINTTISFSSDNKKSKSSKYLLTENTFVNAEVENLVASRVQKWKVRDLKATNITSGLNASLLTDGVKLEAQNLVLEKGSSLSLTVNSRKDWQCSLSNSIIKGKNMLEGKGEINIRNSVLEDATLINNNHEKKKLTISDSELKGYNTIENIKEIACSSVADSNLISNGEPKVIHDRFLEQVNDIDLFLKNMDGGDSVVTNFNNGLEPL